jgi:hypothetical protein
MGAVNPHDIWHSNINLTENNQLQTVGRNRSLSEYRWAYYPLIGMEKLTEIIKTSVHDSGV